MTDPNTPQAIAGGPEKAIPAMPATQHVQDYDNLPEQSIVQGSSAPIVDSALIPPFNRFQPDNYARMLISNRHIHIVDGTPMIWNGSMYEAGVDRISKAMAAAFPGLTSAKRKEVMECIRLLLDDELMAGARYIAFSNGVYDIKDDRLLPSSPEHLIPNTIPHRYNPKAICPELDEAFDQWACDNDDVRKNLEEVLGVAMYRGREFHIIPLLMGDGGNGKSSYMRLAQGMLGARNYSVLDPAEFGKAFSRIELMGKLVNFGDDISRDRLKGDAASYLRKLASGDEIDAEIKYGGRPKFRPYLTPILSCNEFPEAKDDSSGWWRRFRPIPFNADFRDAAISTEVSLVQRLSSEAAYERAIVLGLQGLKRVLRWGDLSPLTSRQELIDDLRKGSSSVYSFACDVLGFGSDDQVDIEMVKTSGLYEKYAGYCNAEGIKNKESHRAFTRKLGKLYGMKSENRRGADGGQGRRFVPIR